MRSIQQDMKHAQLLQDLRAISAGTLQVADDDFETRRSWVNRASSLCETESTGDPDAKREIQYCLNHLYERAFAPERDDGLREPLVMLDVRRVLENHLLNNELRQIAAAAVESSP